MRGPVHFDRLTRGIHATDASHYQVMPACVVVPRDADDAVAAIRIAGRHELPVTARGGGTSLSGQTMWAGMVLDVSKGLDEVLEVDVDERWARVGPGVVRDRLNVELRDTGLHFAPDPATANRATIGGMIGNNTSGMRSVIYGKTIDHVIEVRIALADGTVLDLAPCSRAAFSEAGRRPGREGEIFRGVEQVVAAHRDEIDRRFPKVMRRVSGYNLDAFGREGPWNLAHLVVGSEGTLGVVLEAKIRLTPPPAATALCVAHFDDVITALEPVETILEHDPSAIELLDDRILDEARRNLATAGSVDFLVGRPSAVLIIEAHGADSNEAGDRARRLAADLERRGIGSACPVVADATGQAAVWNVRRLGLGLISNVRGPTKGQAFVEDACVPVGSQAEYARALQSICGRHGVPLAIYGHASVGVLHARPMLDLHQPQDVEKMKAIADEAFDLVVRCGGCISGEHGDGLVRGGYLERFFGTDLFAAFGSIKRLFDPKGLMNPGKVVDVPPMTENLRYGPDYRVEPITSKFHYRDQGGFALAIEQCNGVGACRKVGSGTMCPSYMATRDEAHSTRGRANALRLAISGQLGPDALTGDALHEVLDLCLSCKACKSECPNNVDMARLKSEFLDGHHRRHGVPWSTRLVGAMPAMAARLAGPAAPAFNWLQRRGLARRLLAAWAGIDRRRTLPEYARRPFSRWSRRHAPRRGGPRIVLFVDTYMNCFEPQVGIAAVELLDSCGYEVVISAPGCCQRPRLSKGLLDPARRHGAATLRALARRDAELPIVVCEPSCASSLADDLPDLVADEALGASVAGRIRMIDVFLADEIAAGRLEVSWHSPHDRIVLHGHCHQRALFGTAAMKSILARVDGLEVEEVDSGCCGMAGSFGYEHYDLSMRIGAERLFDAVRQRPEGAVVVASGTSCRHQIADACGVRARHWVETVRARFNSV